MINLADPSSFSFLDPKNVYGSTQMLPDQCKQIWEEVKAVQLPENFAEIDHIVVCGMGASAYDGHVLASLFRDQLNSSVIVVSDYHLPGFVNDKTLVVLSSYSGGTEEPLNCGQEAVEKKLKTLAITSGGKLAQFAAEHQIPALVFKGKSNPADQPRLGAGYTIFGLIGLLNKLGLVSVSDSDVAKAIDELLQNQDLIKQQAQELAQKLYGFIPLIVAAEFLSANAHIMRNQIHETAKSFAECSIIPELNHHLMEGLKNPPDKKIVTLFIESDLFSPKIKRRVEVTKDVVSQNNIFSISFQAQGSSKIAQMLNVLSFGGYLSLYLAFLYGQDPSVIPWVDYFKKKLAS